MKIDLDDGLIADNPTFSGKDWIIQYEENGYTHAFMCVKRNMNNDFLRRKLLSRLRKSKIELQLAQSGVLTSAAFGFHLHQAQRFLVLATCSLMPHDLLEKGLVFKKELL